jgi:hypothetical protein
MRSKSDNFFSFFCEKIILWSQSYQTLLSSFFWFSLLSLAISKYIQYFLMLQTLKLKNENWKKSSFYQEKSFVGLTPLISYSGNAFCRFLLFIFWTVKLWQKNNIFQIQRSRVQMISDFHNLQSKQINVDAFKVGE